MFHLLALFIAEMVKQSRPSLLAAYHPVMKLPTTLQRSRMMAGIRGKNTGPELKLRYALFAVGFRYRLHRRNLPGSPDMVFPKYRAALFVHGCFWHRHMGCRYATTPKSNIEFWHRKFEGNVSRDERNHSMLRQSGWRVAIVWECALKRSVEDVVESVGVWLQGDENELAVK